MNNKIKGHSAILIANTIFGLGIPVTKYLLDSWVTPMTYMASRCIGAAAIFWLISFFMPKEHILRKDLVIIILGGLTGVVISQTLTAWALNYTSPVYYSLIATLTPIFVMVLAAPLLKEKISATKILGIILGITGAMLMVVCKWQSSTGSNDLLGIALALLSLLTWVVYLVITRKVSTKYSPVTQMKWVFLVSAIAILPFSWHEFAGTPLYGNTFDTGAMPGMAAMLFIIVLATVMGYFLIPFAMKYLHATTVSIYTNLQPVIASLVAIYVGQDVLTWDKPAAALLVLISAYIVTKKENDA